jgi:hypothetical protein
MLSGESLVVEFSANSTAFGNNVAYCSWMPTSASYLTTKIISANIRPLSERLLVCDCQQNCKQALLAPC